MSTGRRLLLAPAVLLAALACGEKGAVEERGATGVPPAPAVVRIVFDLPGDDIGSPEDRALLREVREALTAADAAEVLGAGYGMGRMELRLAAAGADLERVRAILRERAPGARYRIESAGR